MHIEIHEKQYCCGCNACSEACPIKCISMKVDPKGFYYPYVDSSRCINCSRCLNVCPITNENESFKPINAMAAWSRSRNVLENSTSGGVAYEISRAALEDGAIVYGCAFDGLKAKHIRVTSSEDLHRLQGSKYVQSDIGGIMSNVKQDLQYGSSVVFFGTPCQISGLRNFLGRPYDNLHLVDLICHGVPSSQMLEEHLSRISKGRVINSLSFRDGEKYVLKVSGERWTESRSFFRDSYIAGFLSSVSLRESCLSCKFASESRYSDLTLGDYWGLGDVAPVSFEHPDKISVILIQSPKGESLIKRWGSNMESFSRPVEEAVKGNWHLRHSAGHTMWSFLFAWLYPTLSFDVAVRIATLNKVCMKLLKRCRQRILRG